MKNKKNTGTKPSRRLKNDSGLVLHSRQGTEEGMLLEGGNGEIIAWFFKDSNNLVSAETLMRWAKQAQVYEKALKKQKALKAAAPRKKVAKKKP
jgi:hypothetical protein